MSDHHVEVPAEATRLARERIIELVQMVPDKPLYMALHEDTVALALQAAAPSIRAEERERLTPKCERCGGDGDEAVEGGNAPCGDCYGTGLRHDRCPDCKGEGRVEAGPAGATYSSPCERCKARGYVQAAPSVTQLEAQAAQQERERIEAALSGDEANRAVTEVLDDEFARATGGEAVTDYALANRILKAALATLKEEDH